MHVCGVPGCPELTESGRCPRHPPDQASRNHHGVPRQARGLGADFDALKPLVLERDGYRCQLSLPGCTRVATTADHIVPRSWGGLTVLANLRAACGHCNNARGARPLGVGGVKSLEGVAV
jgi:5-methylcytosine-specific restriction endonuclease McrA